MKKRSKSIFGSIVLFFVLLFSSVTAFANTEQENQVGIPNHVVFPDKLESVSLEGENTFYSSESPNLTAIGKERMRQAKGKSIPAVDNSQLKYFPEIGDQGKLSTCQYFVDTYYTYTFMYAMKYDIDVKALGEKATFSPAFGFPDDDYGVVTLEQMPYSEESEYYDNWPTSAAVWREALSKKAKGKLIIADHQRKLPYDEAMMKEYLSNGYLFSIGTRMDGLLKNFPKKLKDNPDSTRDDAEVGNLIFSWEDSTEGAHAVTLVGYNDDIWCDKNFNNIIDEGELGGFKIANSWGKEWGNKGFFWVSYDDFERGFTTDSIYTILPPDEPYEPELTAEITFETKDTTNFYFYTNYAGLTTKFDMFKFKTHASTPIMKGFNGTMVQDLGRMMKEEKIDYINTEYDWFLFKRNTKIENITMHKFQLTDGEGNVLAEADNLPYAYSSKGDILARLTYGYVNRNGPWDFTFDPNNGKEPTMITAERGDTISALPDPVKENFVFQGWYDQKGQKISFPYLVDGRDHFTAKWSTDYMETLNMELERLELNLKKEESIQYRQFKSRGEVPVADERTAWRTSKSYSLNGKTYVDISSMLDNSQNVLLEFKVGNGGGEPVDFFFYLEPRSNPAKVKLDPAKGFTERPGFAKLSANSNNSFSYREKNSDIVSRAEVQDGFLYLPVTGYKTSYVLQSWEDNKFRDGMTMETAYKPGSKEVTVNLSAPAKEPQLKINTANDSIKITTKMEISLDQKLWYPVSDNPSKENTFVYYKGIGGISLQDPLLKEQDTIYVREAATPKKPAGQVATLHLGKQNPSLVTTKDLVTSNGKKLFAAEASIQYIPVGNLSLSTGGSIHLTGKEKWKTKAIPIPNSGNAEYYVRYAPTGVYQAGKVVKLIIGKEGDYKWDESAKERISSNAPTVKCNATKDSISLKMGMEVLDTKGTWHPVTQNSAEKIWLNPAIGGVSITDPILQQSAREIGGIYVRKSAAKNKLASLAQFVEIPEPEFAALTTDDFTTLDGKSIDLKSGELQYMEAAIAPTSIFKDNILQIMDRRAKWKSGNISLKNSGEYYVRRGADSTGSHSYVTKISVKSNGEVRILH